MSTSVVSGGPIGNHFIDRASYHRTLKLYAPGVKFAEVYNSLTDVIEGKDIQSIGKVNANTFQITIPDEASFHIMKNAAGLVIHKKFMNLTPVAEQTVDIKCHWLPDYVADDFLGNWFERFGSVRKITRDVQFVNKTAQIQNGVRTVTLITGEVGLSMIPHLVKFDGGTTMLITIQGRDPLCLKCHIVGHMRRACPGTGQRTWASVAQEVIHPPQRAPSQPTPTAPREPTATTSSESPVPTGDQTDEPSASEPTRTGDGDSPLSPEPSRAHWQPDPSDMEDDLLTPAQRPRNNVDHDDVTMSAVSANKRPSTADSDGEDDYMTHVIKRGRPVLIPLDHE